MTDDASPNADPASSTGNGAALSRADGRVEADAPAAAPAAPVAGSGTERTDAMRKNSGGWKIFLRDVVIIVVAAVIISAGVKAFLIRSFYIPSGSMMDTLQIDDRIIVNELVPGLIPVQRGDVVVFRDPGGWLTPRPQPEQSPVVAALDWLASLVGLSASDSDDHLIKRVIGLPGDHVVCCNTLGQITINDIPISEPYLRLPQDVTRASGTDFDVVVPENSLWVLGDNRYDSGDSRIHQNQPGRGFVSIDDVVGRAFVVSWPLDHWAWLDNYPLVFGDLDPVE